MKLLPCSSSARAANSVCTLRSSPEVPLSEQHLSEGRRPIQGPRAAYRILHPERQASSTRSRSAKIWRMGGRRISQCLPSLSLSLGRPKSPPGTHSCEVNSWCPIEIDSLPLGKRYVDVGSEEEREKVRGEGEMIKRLMRNVSAHIIASNYLQLFYSFQPTKLLLAA